MGRTREGGWNFGRTAAGCSTNPSDLGPRAASSGVVQATAKTTSTNAKQSPFPALVILTLSEAKGKNLLRCFAALNMTEN